MAVPVEFDPYDPSIVDDPWPTYARLRDEVPAYHGAREDFWALSRFADVKAALTDHETYCSSQGLLVIETTDDYEAPEFPPGNLLLMDPPQHTAFRRLVSTRFLQKDVAALEPLVRRTANELVDRFVERGTAEAMARHHESMAAVSALFAELLVRKRAEPTGDLLSEVANGTVDGEPLGEREFVGFAISMLIAGNDTTTNALASGAHLLATHPDQRARLVADPSLWPSAVEEVLRCEPPVHGLARTLTRDVELHGERLHEGQKVLLLFAAANRDDRQFADPDRFDVGRRAEGHLTFGFGIHHCVGLHLGRLETRIGLQTLVERLGDYEVTADVHWRQAIPTRPMVELPVAFAATRA